jgi:hypothetical protein
MPAGLNRQHIVAVALLIEQLTYSEKGSTNLPPQLLLQVGFGGRGPPLPWHGCNPGKHKDVLPRARYRWTFQVESSDRE